MQIFYLRSVDADYYICKVAANGLCDSSSSNKHIESKVNEIKCETGDVLYLGP